MRSAANWNRVWAWCLALVLLCLLAVAPGRMSAANVRLYLKDGGDLLVSEYQVLEDRVRYYSVERSQWEEIPLNMVDLEKTRSVEQQKEKASQERAEEDRIERAAERKARTELHNVPLDDGIYYLDGEKVVTVQQAEVTIESSKGRTLLKILAPAPIIAGKQTVEVEGKQSKFVVGNQRPMFYMRLEKIERFGIIRLKENKKNRLVQTIQIQPQTKDMSEEQDEVEVFRQQMAPNVYKIWPTESIPAGEYAVIEYTPGEGNIRVWDFSLQPGAATQVPPTEEKPASSDSEKNPKNP